MTAAAATAAWLLLVASVTIGMRTPGVANGGLPAGVSPQIAGLPAGSLPPLRSGYIAERLGLPLLAPSVPRSVERSVDAGKATPKAASTTPHVRTTLRPFVHDNFADALQIEAVPFSSRSDISTATREPDEPSDCASVGGTAWFRYRPTADLSLMADTFGSDHAVSLAVFRGERLGDLALVGCETDVVGNALVPVQVEADQTYVFQITANTGGGKSVFTLRPAGRTTLLSRGYDGEADSDSYPAVVSADGRWVAFESWATNMSEGDDPRCLGATIDSGCTQVYLQDRLSGSRFLVSRASTGRPGDGASMAPSLSADGRLVAFISDAALVPSDRNGLADVYLFDRLSQRVTLESLDSNGEQLPTHGSSGGAIWGEGACRTYDVVSISGDGRLVAFDHTIYDEARRCFIESKRVLIRDRQSGTTDAVVPEDLADSADGGRIWLESLSTDGSTILFGAWIDRRFTQFYTWDRRTRRTNPVGVSSSGEWANQSVLIHSGALSGDGRFAVFNSAADNLVADDTNRLEDVFVHDRLTGTTDRVSIASTGEQATNPNRNDLGSVQFVGRKRSALSDDGRYVSFNSEASNLVAGDSNGAEDVFVHDRETGTTVRVSVSSHGQEADVGSRTASMSADGSVVAFWSAAPNLVEQDENVYSDVFAHERWAS